MSKYKVTIEQKDGQKKIYEGIDRYEHHNGKMKLIVNNEVLETIDGENIKHTYIGTCNEDNKVRQLND